MTKSTSHPAIITARLSHQCAADDWWHMPMTKHCFRLSHGQIPARYHHRRAMVAQQAQHERQFLRVDLVRNQESLRIQQLSVVAKLVECHTFLLDHCTAGADNMEFRPEAVFLILTR
jgi:hypothetical protein